VTHVVVFNVGQGDAILIDSGSQEIVIDERSDGGWVSKLDEYVRGRWWPRCGNWCAVHSLLKLYRARLPLLGTG
jgi:hypothetical protein